MNSPRNTEMESFFVEEEEKQKAMIVTCKILGGPTFGKQGGVATSRTDGGVEEEINSEDWIKKNGKKKIRQYQL